MSSRLKELVAMAMIGDGVLGAVAPQRHVSLWRQGPPWWEAMMDEFIKRPALTGMLGVAEAAAGLWIAERQWRRRARTHQAEPIRTRVA